MPKLIKIENVKEHLTSIFGDGITPCEHVRLDVFLFSETSSSSRI